MSFFEFPHTRTYDSDLGWLIKEVNRIADQYDSFIEWMNTHKIEYEELDRRVTALEGEINSFEAEIELRFSDLELELKTEMDSAIAQVIHQVNEALNQVELAILNLRSEFNQFKTETTNLCISYYNLGKAYTDFKIEELINSLPDLTTVYVFNPVRGEVTTLQTAIYDIYDMARPHAITAQEYDDLGISAADYDALEITALEYDMEAYTYFENLGLIKNKWHYMYSPINGEYLPLKDVIMQLADLHMGDALTAQEYDDLELTASDYDAYEITAHDYDWSAKTILV